MLWSWWAYQGHLLRIQAFIILALKVESCAQTYGCPNQVIFSIPFLLPPEPNGNPCHSPSLPKKETPQPSLVFYSNVLNHLVPRMFYFAASLVFLQKKTIIPCHDLDNVESRHLFFFFL